MRSCYFMKRDWNLADIGAEISSQEQYDADLIIIGAGPAGLSLAMHLVKDNPAWAGRMLLLEKAAHPRPKLCGGAVTRLGLDILQNLGFELPLPIGQARVNEARIIYAGRTVHVRGSPELTIFNRAELDAYLAKQASRRGISICENEPVKSFQIDDRGVTVITPLRTYRTKALAGADGSKGIVRQILNRSERYTRVARLLEVLTPAPETAEQFTEGFALFDFSGVRKDLQGYFWSFPTQVNGLTTFNRGVYDARISRRRERADLPDLLQAGLQACGEEPGAIHIAGHPIHWFSPRSRLSLPRLLLVGDAAGVDSLFGEGIAPALGYGQAAAQSIEQAFSNGDFSFRDYRRRFLLSPTGRYLLARWWVAWWGYRLSEYPVTMHFIWTVGKIVNRLWPASPPLY